jgi:hypothetical protein
MKWKTENYDNAIDHLNDDDDDDDDDDNDDDGTCCTPGEQASTPLGR